MQKKNACLNYTVHITMFINAIGHVVKLNSLSQMVILQSTHPDFMAAQVYNIQPYY
jgi:hypothetical protein